MLTKYFVYCLADCYIQLSSADQTFVLGLGVWHRTFRYWVYPPSAAGSAEKTDSTVITPTYLTG